MTAADRPRDAATDPEETARGVMLDLADLAAPLMCATPGPAWDSAVREAADRIETLTADDAGALLLGALVALAGAKATAPTDKDQEASVRADEQRKALTEAADAWRRGKWADAPRCADRVQERIANGQYVTDWLRARAAAVGGEQQ